VVSWKQCDVKRSEIHVSVVSKWIDNDEKEIQFNQFCAIRLMMIGGGKNENVWK
jgi:hypothetical protein